MDLSYILNELGEERALYYGAVAPPIVQTSNFAFATVEDMRRVLRDEYEGYLYTRGQNPTVEILRKKLAALDGAEDALAFNSGASAIFAAVLSQVSAGDHIVSVKDPYTWATKMFTRVLPRFGVETNFVDARSVEEVEQAIRPNTRVIYLESPNSWTYAVQDLAALAALAKARGIVTICDNSYCTPLYQRPLEFGIDLVLQSASKYISGHSDVVAGVLSGSSEKIRAIYASEMLNMGNGISPFNAWLLIRGLRTLPLRLERVSASTRQVVEYCKQHPRVESVLYPLDSSFDQYELASRQMTGAGGLFTIVLQSREREKIEKFCEKLRRFLMGVSWGGHESLVIPRCAGMAPGDFDGNNPLHRSVRIYVGLEDPAVLIQDLEQALG